MLFVVLTAVHVLIAVLLTLIVLVQSGKGSDIGAAFGGGASQTMFGARGATTVLHKATAGLAAAFMLTSLVLSMLAGPKVSRSVIPDDPAKPSAPASQPAGEPAGEQKAPGAPGAPGAQPQPSPATPPAPADKPAKAGEPAAADKPTKR